MDERRLRLARGLEDRADRQIGVARERRPDAVRLVGELDVQGIPVGIGVNGDRRDPHLAARADDPDGDLRRVRDQELLLRHSRIVPSMDVRRHSVTTC
jgi:hypothetical protein